MELRDIRFPPIGNNKPYVVTCDGVVFAGFDTWEEAMAARDMYARPVLTPKRTSSRNSLCDWRVRPR